MGKSEVGRDTLKCKGDPSRLETGMAWSRGQSLGM